MTHRSGAMSLLDAHARGLDLAFDQEQRAFDRALDRDRLGLPGLALARERLQMAGDARHALGEIGDQVEVARDLRESPRCAKIFVLAMKVRIAASGWLISCAIAADICPSAASLPACTSSFCVARRRASVRRRSSISVCSEALRFAQLARALGDLAPEARAGLRAAEIGALALHHIEQQRDDQRRDRAADDRAVALVLAHRREIGEAMDGPAVIRQLHGLIEVGDVWSGDLTRR